MLIEGHGRPVTRFEFEQTSPPVVFEDLVIVGSRMPDRLQRKFDPPGTVQAFDARTGKRPWVFFTIPQSSDAYGADTWEDESWRYTGHANVLGLMSLVRGRKKYVSRKLAASSLAKHPPSDRSACPDPSRRPTPDGYAVPNSTP